jgi:probable DNA metabolism protein
MIQYKFDGSLTGLLCCVFESFQAKESNVQVVWDKFYQPSIFYPTKEIFSDEEKADRVWKSFIEKVNPEDKNKFYSSFLAEKPDIFQHLFHLARKVFIHGGTYAKNFADPDVLAVSQMAKSVSRERHRMKAFIRFKKAADGLFYAIIAPDFNVIPLIQKHFQDRYADQTWLIYDEKRRYGIFYDLNSVQSVTLTLNEFKGSVDNQLPILQLHDEKEELYDLLWKDYFQTTNIQERKNTKLHLQHVPKRYWRYLNEK